MTTTILDRSVEAFQEAYSDALITNPDNALRIAVADLLIHAGSELIVIDERAHDFVYHLLRAAAEVGP